MRAPGAGRPAAGWAGAFVGLDVVTRLRPARAALVAPGRRLRRGRGECHLGARGGPRRGRGHAGKEGSFPVNAG